MASPLLRRVNDRIIQSPFVLSRHSHKLSYTIAEDDDDERIEEARQDAYTKRPYTEASGGPVVDAAGYLAKRHRRGRA